jgi:excisionase family DNA binding protein
MTPEQLENLLPKIYRHIQAVVRSATTEAVEALLKDKAKDSNVAHDFLSAPQAADFLKLKLGTIYKKAEKGELPHSRSGKRKLLFSKKDLVEYVARRKVMSSEEISEQP